MAQRGAECPVGEAAKGSHLLLERPGSDKLGYGGKQRHSALGDPQAPHQPRPIFAKISGHFDGSGDLVEERVGTFLDKTRQESPLLDRNVAQKRAVAKDRREQAFTGRRCAPSTREAGSGRVLRNGERLAPSLEPEGETARVGRFGQPVTFGGEVR